MKAEKLQNAHQYEAEFIRLWQAHRARLRGYVRAAVSSPTDVDEVLQETCIVLWDKFNEYKPGSSFFAWAVSVARFEILRFYQEIRHQRVVFNEPAMEAIALRASKRASQYEIFWETLGQCLKRMTDRQRDLFHRRFILSETPREIAKQLEQPSTTIYSALQKLRRQLAECLSRHLSMEEKP